MSSSTTSVVTRCIEEAVKEMRVGIRYSDFNKIRTEFQKLQSYSEILVSLLPGEYLINFNRHLGFIGYYLKKEDLDGIKSNFDDIEQRDLPRIISATYVTGEKIAKKKVTPLSRRVFIVHGHEIEPVEELRTMLNGFGLNVIVLHEQPSGGLTLAEKLERYSENIGFAFVILTPDDVGCQERDVAELKYGVLGKPILKRPILVHPSRFDETLRPRARQNVIFEMGYFWGLLKRKRVCCLLKGDVERPSDIEGIVYIPFKESVNECRDKIVKELKQVGYKI